MPHISKSELERICAWDRDEWVVEKITDMEVRDGERYYKVHWAMDNEITWEPRYAVTKLTALDDYEKSKEALLDM